MRILFMGTPDFAAVCLRRLIDEKRDIVGVISQPDRPRGRGYVMTPPPVKVCAQEAGIPVFQPDSLKGEEFADLLSTLAPDVITVVAYGKLLPKSVLDFPKYGCVNVHGSLLPSYRGAAPMQRAIMNGDSITGITTMYMAEGLDTGDMLLRAEVPILPEDNFESVHDKMAGVGARLLCETLDGLSSGSITPIPQDDSLATYASKITKEDCHLDFTRTARELDAIVRGLSPMPLAFAYLQSGKTIKIISAHPVSGSGDAGEVIACDARGEGSITVACRDGALAITQIVPAGKGRMSAGEFIRGRKISVGERLN